MDALTTYKLFAANSERTLDRLSNSPTISREVDYYENKIGSIASAKEFVSDQRLLNFALKAYGLEEMGYAKAFMEKLLKDGVDDREALANQLTDPRYKEFAKDFNFVQFGSATTSFERTQSGVINKFLQQTLEQEAGNQNTGARLAIYFERKSADIEDAFSILGDPALLQVVQTSFGFPVQMSFLPIDRQAEMINERIDVKDLNDPKFMSDLTTRFLALWDVNNPTVVSVPPLISQPFGSQQTLTIDLLASIQNLRLR